MECLEDYGSSSLTVGNIRYVVLVLKDVSARVVSVVKFKWCEDLCGVLNVIFTSRC